MKCISCDQEKAETEFYAKDKKCKDCRCALVRANRLAKVDQYRSYEASRNALPHRVQARRDYRQTEAGKAARAEASRRYRQRQKERYAATNKLNNAVRDGRIQKLPCFICGALEVEAHHPAYSLPLDVAWLCNQHHREIHDESPREDYDRS